MEETEKSFTFLSDCAEVAEKLKTNALFNTVKIKISVPSKNYLPLLKEIEQFVRVKVDKSQETIAITISDVEFIFEKET
jgi:hypothetical protein